MKRISKLVIVILYFSLNIKCTSQSKTFASSIDPVISLSIHIKEFRDYNDYDLIVVVKNNSKNRVLLPWSIMNIFVQDNNLPNLSIKLSSTGMGKTYLLHDNVNRLNFKEPYRVISIDPSGTFEERIRMKALFGNSIPEHDALYVTYGNSNKMYGNKEVYTGEVVSNFVKLDIKKR